MLEGTEYVWVRRQWNDYRDAKVCLSDIEGIQWGTVTVSGGVYIRAPQPFLHGYISCDTILEGELGHSCLHGEGPHRIKVCIVKKRNNPSVFKRLVELAGPKPGQEGRISPF